MENASDADSEIWGWRSFFDQISQFLGELQHHFGTANERYAQYAVERLEVCIANVRDLRHHLNHHGPADEESRVVIEQYDTQLAELLYCMEKLCDKWSEYCDEVVGPNNDVACVSYRTPMEYLGSRGRPRFCITQSQLQYLKSLAFTWSEIASILGVSRMTLYRRRVEYGMLDDPSELLRDEELQERLTQMRREYPQFGETMAMGHLRSLGYHVSRERLRNAVRVTDPINRALRWRGVLTARRPYSVPGPNSLWHIGELCTFIIILLFKNIYFTLNQHAL